ncbi:CHAP domain-containing protein, partial [Streptosporangium sandarakinum]
MQKFIELLESQLGYSEKSDGYTKFGGWYDGTVESKDDYTSAPWCDMYLSWAAHKLGYESWVGQFAYTVYHARWFKEQDAWGTTPKPGAIVFFDWGGSNKIDRIDHVGIVTKVEGRKIHTIEGNVDGGVAKRKVRDTDKVVGYGYPEKIKARLEKEAAEKKTVITSSDVRAENSVEVSPDPGVLALFALPDPVPVEKTGPKSTAKTTAKAAPKHAKGPGKHAAPSPSPTRVETTTTVNGTGTADATGTTGTTGTTAGITGTTAGKAAAPSGSSAGKHAKPATADTKALAADPVASGRDLSLPAPQLGSPTVLAPVLLTAMAMIAHARIKQSRTRLALAGATPAAPSRKAPARRAPGRRRA